MVYLPSVFVAAPSEVPFTITFAPIKGDLLVESLTVPVIEIPDATAILICKIKFDSKTK